LSRALEVIRAYSAAANWDQPLTTFYGADPTTPSLELTTGQAPSERQAGGVDSAEPKLYGVFVGIDRYADSRIPPLNYAKADALGMFELARRALGPADPAPQLTCLADTDATRKAVVWAIGENLSRKVKEQDVVLLYFAGHGSPETSGSIDLTSRYLVLHDTDYDAIFATGLDLERELPVLCFDRLRARLIVVFIDACFSGLAGGRTFQGPHLLRARLKRGVRGPVKLSELQLGEARVIITACDDHELARESSDLGHGVLTYYVIQELTRRHGDDASVTLSQLYDVVSSNVTARSHGLQHPIFNGRTREGRLPRFPPDPRP